MKIRYAVLVLVSILLFRIDAEADVSDLKTELKNYVQQNVMPVLKQERIALDAKISSEDKIKLDNLRNKLREIRVERRNFMQEVRSKRLEQRYPLNEEEKAVFTELREQMSQVMFEAGEIARNYKEDLRLIHEDLKDEKQLWSEEIREIIEQSEELDQVGKRRFFKRHKNQLMHHLGLLKPVVFLLWDVEDGFVREIDSEAFFNVYPNPTARSNTVSFSLSQPGMVTIEVINTNNGSTIKKVVDDFYKAGEYQVEVDLSDLNQAIYSYRISTPDGVGTKKIVKK